MIKKTLICFLFSFILLFIQISTIFTENTTTTETTTSKVTTCNLQTSSKTEINLLKGLENLKLLNKQYTANDPDHSYNFGICTKANNASNDDDGLIQINKKTGNKFIIGKLNNVDIEGTIDDGWIYITYRDGQTYNNACNKSQRQAKVMIKCSSEESFKIIEENNERNDDRCGYIFQLKTPLMCSNSSNTQSTSTNSPATTTQTAKSTTTATTTATTKTTTAKVTSENPSNLTTTSTNSNSTSSNLKPNSKVGFFSIILIIVLVVLVSYFIIGTLYNRFVNQTRGIEQFPNWRFWHSLGIKFQECGQFICRCGKKPTEIRSYEHINDQLSDDENLLNM